MMIRKFGNELAQEIIIAMRGVCVRHLVALLLALPSHGLSAQPAWAGKRVCIFGGGGFIGSRVCRACIEQLGCRSVTSVSRSGGPPEWAKAEAWASQVTWAVGDTSQDGVAELCMEGGVDGVVSCVGMGDVLGMATDGWSTTPYSADGRSKRQYFYDGNGPPNQKIAAAAKSAGATRLAYVGVAQDAENGLRGSMPGLFEGKQAAAEAAQAALGDGAIVFGPHAVYSGQAGALMQGLLSSGAGRGLVGLNRAIGEMGWRGEDLVTKARLTPPVDVEDLALALGAAAVGLVDVAKSERTVYIEGGVEVVSSGKYVDGTDAIQSLSGEAAPRLGRPQA